MKVDMHCHTKEGSLDGKVSIERYIEVLKEKGFGGMLVTDHDSYNGYRYWKNNIKGKKHKDFKVFKGIEYDTLAGGHIIVIMPHTVKLRLLELRGLPIQLLIPIVHNYGGILGPAHPYGEKFMSFMNSRAYKRNPKIIKEFDFIEIFNSCESNESNENAVAMSKQYHLSGIAGSDSHKEDCIGLAFTDIPDEIENETELIKFIKCSKEIQIGGQIYLNTSRGKMGRIKIVTSYMFWVYNKLGGWFRSIQRNGRIKKGYVEQQENIENTIKTGDK